MGSPHAELQIRHISKHAGVNSTTDLVVADQNLNSVGRRSDDLLYKVNSYECFQNLPYQRQCMEELFSRIYTEGQPPDSTELLRLLQALSMQAPSVQLPLPVGFTPLIRFDSEKVPYFEFHFFTQSLPLMPPLSGTDFLKTVDKTVLDYSAAILESMIEVHMWTIHGYPVPVNVARNVTNSEKRRFENMISTQFKENGSATSSASVTSSAAVNTNFKAIEWEPKSSTRHSMRALKPVSKEFPAPAKNVKANKNTKKNMNESPYQVEISQKKKIGRQQLKYASSKYEEKYASSINVDEFDEIFDNKSFSSESQEKDIDSNSSLLSDLDTSITENASTLKKAIRNCKPNDKEFPSNSAKTSTPVKHERKKNSAKSIEKRLSISAHHSTKPKKGKPLSRSSINCKKCNREFSRTFTYIRHVNDVHKKVKPFVCQFPIPGSGKCGYSCSQEYQTKKHIEKRHDVQENHVDKYLLIKRAL